MSAQNDIDYIFTDITFFIYCKEDVNDIFNPSLGEALNQFQLYRDGHRRPAKQAHVTEKATRLWQTFTLDRKRTSLRRMAMPPRQVNI
jgi:hypothetical protein